MWYCSYSCNLKNAREIILGHAANVQDICEIALDFLIIDLEFCIDHDCILGIEKFKNSHRDCTMVKHLWIPIAQLPDSSFIEIYQK